MLRASYAVSANAGSRPLALWRSVRDELWRVRSLLPLLQADVLAPWHGQVGNVRASSSLLAWPGTERTMQIAYCQCCIYVALHAEVCIEIPDLVHQHTGASEHLDASACMLLSCRHRHVLATQGRASPNSVNAHCFVYQRAHVKCGCVSVAMRPS